jgi:hypothetical protein
MFLRVEDEGFWISGCRVFEEGGNIFEKTITFKEIKYLDGNLSTCWARHDCCLWPILPQLVWYTSNLAYFKLIQVSEPLGREKLKPGFNGLLTSMFTSSLRKLLKIASASL